VTVNGAAVQTVPTGVPFGIEIDPAIRGGVDVRVKSATFKKDDKIVIPSSVTDNGKNQDIYALGKAGVYSITAVFTTATAGTQTNTVMGTITVADNIPAFDVVLKGVIPSNQGNNYTQSLTNLSTEMVDGVSLPVVGTGQLFTPDVQVTGAMRGGEPITDPLWSNMSVVVLESGSGSQISDLYPGKGIVIWTAGVYTCRITIETKVSGVLTYDRKVSVETQIGKGALAKKK
jgi:hypothetical protein